MFGLGPTEIILIVLALLLLFGGKKIPELMRGLGTGMKEFKKATSDDEPKRIQNPADTYAGQGSAAGPETTSARPRSEVDDSAQTTS